jgi:hypothetical protein
MFRVRQSGKFENVLKTLSGGAVAGHGEDRLETKQIVFERIFAKMFFAFSANIACRSVPYFN